MTNKIEHQIKINVKHIDKSPHKLPSTKKFISGQLHKLVFTLFVKELKIDKDKYECFFIKVRFNRNIHPSFSIGGEILNKYNTYTCDEECSIIFEGNEKEYGIFLREVSYDDHTLLV